MKVSENTKVSTDLKTILSIVVGVAVGVWAYFGIEERLNKLETADTLFQADLLKKAEQEPKNLEMYMLIEHLATQIESCLLYTSPSPRDGLLSRMPSSA